MKSAIGFAARSVGMGLVHLTELTVLETFCLYGTQVADGGVAELTKALPNCRVFS